MTSRLKKAGILVLGVVCISVISSIPWLNSRLSGRRFVAAATIPPTTSPDRDNVSAATHLKVDFPSKPLHLHTASPSAAGAYEMMFSEYLPDLLKQMGPPVDFAEKYHRPEESFLPKSFMGFRTSLRAGDSFEYDIPGTYTHTGDLYFLALGATRPINNRLSIGVDAYFVAESQVSASGFPGPVGRSGSFLKVGTYDLATFGIGPSVTFTHDFLGRDVDFRLKAFHEFNGDGSTGRGVFLSAGIEF